MYVLKRSIFQVDKFHQNCKIYEINLRLQIISKKISSDAETKIKSTFVFIILLKFQDYFQIINKCLIPYVNK